MLNTLFKKESQSNLTTNYMKNITGKNDGCVAGKRYFQCETKKGIFSRLERLTREPLGVTDGPSHMDHSFRSIISPARSGTVSPTHSISSNISRTPGSSN